ncbi:hypothetical protein OPU71_10365 [Niveibacterium sp. 24ML]|uniref:hypothetical protein n=1 Tax=Niveibacterium sp. 24ML TaxID=2985512 RepID=UPI0022703929|nr:hypothetical protein [Niveibacterium sp. 24ML]MCX9156524.1 hypothetical protein [Niveibacterium sp. 24ML]
MRTVDGLPDWFCVAFAHLAPDDFATVSALWKSEPALRTVALLIDTLHPSRHRHTRCPCCGHVGARWHSSYSDAMRNRCEACGKSFTNTVGTPFFRVHERNWPALYGTLVVLWGPWTPVQAWRIAGCTDAKQLADFRRRLAPLFEQLPDDTLLASRAAYRLGFTPNQQGVLCLRCGGRDIVYRKRGNHANPTFACLNCRYQFQLHASRRHMLPLDESVRCPDCSGRALNRSFIDTCGRQHYRCRDCKRNFVTQPRKRHPSQGGGLGVQ